LQQRQVHTIPITQRRLGQLQHLLLLTLLPQRLLHATATGTATAVNTAAAQQQSLQQRLRPLLLLLLQLSRGC
jgi:hypothetical protein